MRLSALILVLVFLKAAVLPNCSSGHYCAEEESHHNQHEQEDSEDGHCGSACICFGCGLNYVAPTETQTTIHQAQLTNSLTIVYAQLVEQVSISGIWHPPALV